MRFCQLGWSLLNCVETCEVSNQVCQLGWALLNCVETCEVSNPVCQLGWALLNCVEIHEAGSDVMTQPGPRAGPSLTVYRCTLDAG